MQRRNKDKDQYLKFIAIIDIIMKNSDENHPLTVNQIKEKFYQQKRNFQIDYRAIKKYIEFFHRPSEPLVILSCFNSVFSESILWFRSHHFFD